ncbi:hypothetical protein K438DRAFT_1674233 [Mycena galopus ATCC 62051]|nr:hypothetical protein K438DRAFT_1728396 [Mycena galopus ATCC 62051]KAF8175624.1 hypothetical protein K438DRAFT_1727596 [Mycena galopus ATCC 62051]KAF8194369.1 hypothetical protein K438DRAFT_1674233 [Mycena galopus ATCC 62051]
MPNPTGSNGRTPQEYPADDVLLEAFTKYAQENSGSGLEWKDQLVRLKQDFNLDIRKTTLFKLRDRVNAPSVRKAAKTLHPAVVSQEVADIKQNDALGLWGVTQVKGRLANEKILITRDALRTALHDNHDEEFADRFVGKKKDKHRTPLYALGPWHQEHMDGHEKLGEQALQIGKGIHLPIYASKDQFSPFLHSLVLMPNVRNSDAIAHFYLDLVEGRGYLISIQVTVDGGVEVVEMVKIHERLRADAAPLFVPPEWPYYVSLPSTQNTPIESFWRWKRNGEGRSIRHVLEQGSATGIFLPGDDIHSQTFYWIWVPFIQERLDIFRDYWNNHRIRKSKNKQNASGSSPKNMLLNPQAGRVTARDCSIRVNPQLVDEIREIYGGAEGRDKAYRFVSQIFQAAADGAYVQLGCPEISLDTIWDVFTDVVKILEASS